MKRTALLLIMTMLTGCATIVHGTNQDFKIETNPSGLAVFVKEKSCITPCTINVPRSSREITITKTNGMDLQIELDRFFNVWSVIPGNLWNFIFPGAIVDLITGAAWTIEDIDFKFLETEAIPEKADRNENTRKKNNARGHGIPRKSGTPPPNP